MIEPRFGTRAVGVIVAFIAIGGCATTPPTVSGTKPAPKERLLAFQKKTSRSTWGRLRKRIAKYVRRELRLEPSDNREITEFEKIVRYVERPVN